MMLGLDAVEDEASLTIEESKTETEANDSKEEKPKSKRSRKKKVVEKTEESETTEVSNNEENYLANAKELLANAKDSTIENTFDEESTNEDKLKKALDTVVVCNDSANASMKSLQGKTIEEILTVKPTFCDFVKTRENIKSMFNEETIEAAIYIANNQ